MNTITNIGIQLFTYECSSNILGLLHATKELLSEPLTQRYVWSDLDGSRKSAALHRILANPSNYKFNEGYAQKAKLHPELQAFGLNCDLLVHLNISPDSDAWHATNSQPASGKPVNRLLVRNLSSYEKCARNHKPEIMPTVLEITLTCKPIRPELISKPMVDLLKRMWAHISELECYATADFGGWWLNFPHNMGNSSTYMIEIFNASHGKLITRRDWGEWRERHNISLETCADKSGIRYPNLVVHSNEPRLSLTEFQAVRNGTCS